MFRKLALFSLFLALCFGNANLFAKVKLKKQKKSGAIRSHRSYRPSKHKRKSRHYRHSGSNVDLKSITTDSPYKETPDNGVNSVETKPALN